MTGIDPAQISDSPCPLCGSLETWVEGWPVCACDDALPDVRVTVREAARYLYKSPSGIYHMINDGDLAAIRSSHPLQIRMVSLKGYRVASKAYWRYYATPACHEPRKGRGQ